MNFIDCEYDWKNITLADFLSEGNIPSGWNDFFSLESIQTDLSHISETLSRPNNPEIYPAINQVFRAFYETPLDKVKVVLLGQDPYHNGSAVGLCFSVKPGNSINPSLTNIYKELELEGFSPTKTGDISHWAGQGVFMINTALTVFKGHPNSHSDLWDNFTTSLVEYISSNTPDRVVWLLWGNNAHEYIPYIKGHSIVFSSHPSPYSALKATSKAPAFIGSGCFRKVNDILISKQKLPIEW